MSNTQDLYNLFESFCSFGSSRNLATGSVSNLEGPAMDNQKFNKFAKDTNIVDGKKVTSTDCDILFNKVKAKGARKIGFEEFQVAFQALADKKYKGKNSQDAYESLLNSVVDKSPVARGVTIAAADGVFNKLTNTQLYTGTHKNRFDENGVGKGADGRQMIDSRTHDLNQLVNRDSNGDIPNNTYSGSTTGVGAAKKRGTAAIITASTEGLEIKANPAQKKQDFRSSQSSLRQNESSSNKSNGSLSNINKASNTGLNKSSTGLNKSSTTGLNKSSTTGLNKSSTGLNKSTITASSKSGAAGSGNVFDRLTNVNGYTGAHKERFNADGSGRGIAGRGTVAKGAGTHGTYQGGDVHSLAQILRN